MVPSRGQASAKKKKMEDRIKAMEAKLIQGGKMMDKAALQEAVHDASASGAPARTSSRTISRGGTT